MVRFCVICGANFLCSPSNKKVTCGKKTCVSERKRQTHLRLAPRWSGTAKQRKAALGQTTNLKMGTAAAIQSPVAGPFETNQEAKLWWIISPEGTRYHLRNLRKFCRDHPDLFAPDPWQNPYAGLRQVQSWLMEKKPRTVSQWKGWLLERPAASPEEIED